MYWIETIADTAQLGSMSETSKKETAHQNDKHEDEKEVKGVNTNPAHRRSITEASNQEIMHQERDEHEEEEEEEEKEDKLTSKTHTQQKTSCRRKMIPHNRTDNFLWG